MFAGMSLVGVGGATIFMLWVHESHTATHSLREEAPRVLRPLLRVLSAPPRFGQGAE